MLGAGFMGAGIAYVAANAGLEVVLIDRDLEAAEKGKAHSHKLVTDQIMKGRAKTADRDALLARITPSADYADLAGCELVVEAVFEDPKVKAEAIAKAEAAIGRVHLASNTSTLPITGLASHSSRPEQFIGIHFFSPVEKMMLVEVILARQTGDRALAGRSISCAPSGRRPSSSMTDAASRQSLRRQLYPRRAPDAHGGRAARHDREHRANGGHARWTALAQRRAGPSWP